jgi:hypothetical protein
LDWICVDWCGINIGDEDYRLFLCKENLCLNFNTNKKLIKEKNKSWKGIIIAKVAKYESITKKSCKFLKHEWIDALDEHEDSRMLQEKTT